MSASAPAGLYPGNFTSAVIECFCAQSRLGQVPTAHHNEHYRYAIKDSVRDFLVAI